MVMEKAEVDIALRQNMVSQYIMTWMVLDFCISI